MWRIHFLAPAFEISLMFSLLSGTAVADGGLPVAEPAGSITPTEIARLIDQFESPEFAQRQEASLKLAETGKAAFPELEKAAAAPIREVSNRALDIFKQHFQQGEPELKQAAQESLARLAASPNSSLGQRAKNVIDPPRPAPYSELFGPVFPGRQVQNNFPPPAPPTRTVSISDINGKREVKVNDDFRSIQMQTWPSGRIEIDIQEKNGQPPKKVDAKDLDDLKAKDADIATLYQQFQNGPRPLATPPRPLGAIPATNSDAARRLLDNIDASIQRSKERLPNDPNAQRMIDSLERLKQELRGAVTPPVIPAPPPRFGRAPAFQ